MLIKKFYLTPILIVAIQFFAKQVFAERTYNSRERRLFLISKLLKFEFLFFDL